MAFDQAELDCQGRGRGPNQERFLVLHSQWSGEKAFDLCQNLQRETRSSMTITAATAFLDAAFQVYLNRLFSTQQEQLVALPAFIVLPAETRSKVTYCLGYSVFKVVTRELRKQQSNQDGAFIQVLDGIQYQAKADALQACEADVEYKALMQYTVQRCRGDVNKPFSGLRYVRHAVLPAFFLIEQLAAHFLSPRNMQTTSFTQLQHAVSGCSEVWDLWFGGLEALGFQGLWMDQDGDDSHPETADDDAGAEIEVGFNAGMKPQPSPQFVKAFQLLSAQYLRIWLRESLRKYEKQVKMDKLDALRTTLKNRLAKGKAGKNSVPAAYECVPEPPSQGQNEAAD